MSATEGLIARLLEHRGNWLRRYQQDHPDHLYPDDAPVDAAELIKTQDAELARLRGREEECRKALDRAAVAAYSEPHYLGPHGFTPGADGLLPPGSPYDRGRYDARKAVEAIIRALSPTNQKGDQDGGKPHGS